MQNCIVLRGFCLARENALGKVDDHYSLAIEAAGGPYRHRGRVMTSHEGLRSWVQDVAQLTKPNSIQWCDGSEGEYKRLVALMVEKGDLIPLNEQTHPGCYLHRSHPSDVARTENLTFICTTSKEDAGPNNNWMAPDDAHRKLDGLFDGAMKGRTMYVVPYVMGPIDSPYASAGVEITDSPYVAASMRVMTRMGAPALKHIESNGAFIRG